MSEERNENDYVALTVDIVSAYARANAFPTAQLSELIAVVHASLAALQTNSVAQAFENEPQKPAISVKRSVTHDYIICLEDGLKFKSLKRHLTATYGMTPDDYRKKWSLPPDYPMVAPAYAEKRSALAKASGLGMHASGRRKGRSKK